MKWILTVLFGLVVFPALAQRTSQELAAAGYKRYPVEKGHMVYETGTGETKKTETVYFDRWGWRELRITEQTVLREGQEVKQKQGQFLDGEYTTTIDYVYRKATRRIQPISIDLSNTIEGESLSEKGEKIVLSRGTKQEDQKKLHGYKCNGVQFNDGTINWFWKGLLVLSENENQTTNATTFDMKAQYEVSVFDLPSDIQVMELGVPPGMPR